MPSDPLCAEKLADEIDRTWDRLRDEGWRIERCEFCRGTGVVMVYSFNDIEGPGPCKDCAENGKYYVTPKGRHVEFPGGKFL